METNGRENLVNTRNLLWDEENRLLGVSDNGVERKQSLNRKEVFRRDGNRLMVRKS